MLAGGRRRRRGGYLFQILPPIAVAVSFVVALAVYPSMGVRMVRALMSVIVVSLLGCSPRPVILVKERDASFVYAVEVAEYYRCDEQTVAFLTAGPRKRVWPTGPDSGSIEIFLFLDALPKNLRLLNHIQSD